VDVASTATSDVSFSLTLTVLGPDGVVAATASGNGTVSNGATVTWAPASPVLLPQAPLWHLVDPPLAPALHTLEVQLAVGGVPVDAVNVTFGVRLAAFDNATGFWLNGVRTKILGWSNHQDFAAVGVAVPDHLQWHRVAKLKEIGSNGWRTAHNPPAPALLDAADQLGLLVWDEDREWQGLECMQIVGSRAVYGFLCVSAVSCACRPQRPRRRNAAHGAAGSAPPKRHHLVRAARVGGWERGRGAI